MAKIIRAVGKAAAKRELNAFKAVRDLLETRLKAMTPAQKQNALTVLQNWESATTNQKIETLFACTALLYAVVGWLVYREFGE